MKIRLTHLDGKLPNLALMKLSHWHKSQGHEVHFTDKASRDLFDTAYDRVYGSCIFGHSEKKLELFCKNWPEALVGGTGSGDMALTVEDLIGGEYEHYDYSIYPDYPYSIGFTQRGCRLKCGFCVVPRKEGAVRSTSTIGQIWRGEPWPKKIVLLDNDFFGNSEWALRAAEIIDGNFQVCFSQGINVRLIHAEGAAALARMKYKDDQFQERRIYTAWDNRKEEKVFWKGIDTLLDAGIKPAHVMVYMLCGYQKSEDFERDVYFRFREMKDRGLLPYPMVYDKSNAKLRAFQRYVVRGYYRFLSWEEYQQGEKRATVPVH